MSTAPEILSHKQKWEHYRDTRKATYEFRARTRYAGAYERLCEMGLSNGDTLIDVGAGSQQFGRYLAERGWECAYVPVDAVIDGTDLETWDAPRADWLVCIEVVEHLRNPMRLVASMVNAARRGVVLTTPNPETVDVLTCDPTHVSVVRAAELEQFGFTVKRRSYFGSLDDTLLAWRFENAG